MDVESEERIMNALVKKLIKETWVDYFSGNKEEIEKNIDPEVLKEYEEAMIRLETDFDFQAELGIGV